MGLVHSGTWQLQTVFGSGFVAEHHIDATDRRLSWGESGNSAAKVDAAVSAITSAMFEELLKSLRASLSLR